MAKGIPKERIVIV